MAETSLQSEGAFARDRPRPKMDAVDARDEVTREIEILAAEEAFLGLQSNGALFRPLPDYNILMITRQSTTLALPRLSDAKSCWIIEKHQLPYGSGP